MAVSSEHSRKGGVRRRAICRAVICLLAAVLAVSLPGCGGCRQKPEETKEEKEKREAEERAKKERERKPPLEEKFLTVLPSDGQLRGSGKPGHWTSVALVDAKANHNDFFGELELFAGARGGKNLALPATPFELTHFRQVALPKGQPKTFESLLWIPPSNDISNLSYSLVAGRGGHREVTRLQALDRMPSYQYHFVVLARAPARYGYLGNLDSTKNPTNLNLPAQKLPYRIIWTPTGRRPMLPSYGLFWTTVAYVLWDDYDPANLDPDQQQAMLDWLHWGGQLILSGPDTLDSLRGSFLGPYLPAVSAGTRELKAADLQELQWWSGDASPPQAIKPWTGVRWNLHPQAEPMPHTGELLVERSVGHGRIVASAFRLSSPELLRWRAGWDALVNGGLLRRPGRSFSVGEAAQIKFDWTDKPGGTPDAQPSHPLDPRRMCNLAYFTRDTGTGFNDVAGDLVRRRDDDPRRRFPNDFDPNFDPNSEDFEEGSPQPGMGVAAWNDFNRVSRDARETLQEAARIRVPDRDFIVWVVAGYLLVLVPLNWAVFRAIGRVEWAWAAAPLIAIGCTLLVIHLAQLNIGFARAQSEVAVVEIQGDYPRAHATRYTALYTSLATTYDFTMEDPGGVLLPFPTKQAKDFKMLAGQSYRPLTCRRGEETTISGFNVSSNDIKFIHSEHSLDLKGGLSLAKTGEGELQLANRTQYALHDAGVIRRGETPDTVDAAWVGTLKPGATVRLRFESVPAASELWQAQRKNSAVTAPPAAYSGTLSLHRMMAVAQDVREFRPEQIRLVAWLEDKLPGLTIEPAAPQSQHATLVVANLGNGSLGEPQRDIKSHAEVERESGLPVKPQDLESDPALGLPPELFNPQPSPGVPGP